MTRSFGDFHLKTNKRYITHQPEISTYKIDETCQFLVLGTDGLWDELNEEEVAFLANKYQDP